MQLLILITIAVMLLVVRQYSEATFKVNIHNENIPNFTKINNFDSSILKKDIKN